MRALLDIPTVRYLYDDLDIAVKHGRFRPSTLRLPDCDHVVFVDPTESRARALLRHFARGQPELKALWRALYRGLAPTVVIDVGANYGEFVFSERYGPDVRVIAVEANPRLNELLERSRRAHESASRIELHACLASSRNGEESFYVDESWSGRSSVFASHVRRGVQQRVRSIAIDSLFEGDPCAAERTVLFKIDVEGYEPTVLAGMERLFDKSRWCVGMIELTEPELAAQGLDLEGYLARLRERFSVFEIGRGPTVTRSDQGRVAAHDLLLTTDPSLLARADVPVTAP